MFVLSVHCNVDIHDCKLRHTGTGGEIQRRVTYKVQDLLGYPPPFSNPPGSYHDTVVEEEDDKDVGRYVNLVSPNHKLSVLRTR